MRTRLVAGLVAALGVAGCAGLPESGPVERVAAASSRTHSTVRYEPARPMAGATPQQVVDGYLDAMLAYPEATGIVQSYLTPRAVEDWRSTAGIAVYSRVTPKLGDVSRDRATVVLSAHNVLNIDDEGRASVVSEDITHRLRLERVGGQWRVANPRAGYLVSRRFASDYIRSYPLWFFDESGERLVPESAHAVVSEQLPLMLTRRLAQGPRQSILRTFLPMANDLRVRVAGRIAEVDFGKHPPDPEDKVVGQLLSTLRGVPGLDGVRILVNGVPDGDVHPIDAVVGFGPGQLASHVYAIRADRIVDVTNRIRPISGPWGRSARGAVEVAVGASSVAVVAANRVAVLVGPREGGEVTTYPGTDFADPMWDSDQRLWLADNPQPGGARVRFVQDGTVGEVDAGDLGTLESFAVSPDGTRYAAVVVSDSAAVVVGSIEHNSAGEPTRLLTPRVVSLGRVGERSVEWASQARIDFVGTGRAGAQLYTVGLDGAELSAGKPLDGGVRAWAGPAADGADRWALDRRGKLWRRASGAEWQPVGNDVFRALSSGR